MGLFEGTQSWNMHHLIVQDSASSYTHLQNPWGHWLAPYLKIRLFDMWILLWKRPSKRGSPGI